MPKSPLRDLVVGLFVIAGFGALTYLSVSLGGLSYKGPGGLVIYASFDEIGGLSPRSQVVIGGVKVGQVSEISLDEYYRARVTLELNDNLEIPDDSSASILTQGVLGDQYIAIEPGGSEDLLKSGGEISYTQSAVILERLIGKLVQNIGGGGNE